MDKPDKVKKIAKIAFSFLNVCIVDNQQMNTEEFTEDKSCEMALVPYAATKTTQFQSNPGYTTIGTTQYKSDLDYAIRAAEDAWLKTNLKNAREFVSTKKDKWWTLRDKCEALRIKQQFEEYITLYYERTNDEILHEIASILDFVQFEQWA